MSAFLGGPRVVKSGHAEGIDIGFYYVMGVEKKHVLRNKKYVLHRV
jgi:hypothetical protein